MNPFSDVRVLVVADDRDLFDAIRSALRSSYRLTACRSPKSALALIDGGKRFDILVAAFHLLEMTGPICTDACRMRTRCWRGTAC